MTGQSSAELEQNHNLEIVNSFDQQQAKDELKMWHPLTLAKTV